MNFLDTSISAFANAMDTIPHNVRLGAFLNSQKYKPAVMQVRAENDKERRDILKKKLPAATISGTFNKRSIEGIAQYNGMVCLDFDGKENEGLSAAEMKAILLDIEEVAFASLSVGGAGVFAIILTDNEEVQKHRELVDFFGKIFFKAGLIYDRSCKDVSRLRFISYDEQAYTNPFPIVFPAQKLLFKLEQNTVRPPRPVIVRKPGKESDTEQRVQDYVRAIEGSCVDITQNYEDWYRIGFALANFFGMNGEDYFHRVSQFNPKYNPTETAKKFDELRKNGRRVSIGTFFNICKQQGISLK